MQSGSDHHGRGRIPGLLFVVNSLDVGGAERHVVTLVNRLDRSRFRLHLAYLKRLESLLAEIEPGRLEALECCDARHFIDRGAARCLHRLAAGAIDAVICTNVYSTLYGYLAVRRLRPRPKLVTVLHSIQLGGAKDRIMIAAYRWMARRADLLVYVSESQRDYWATQGLRARSDAVVHNGIDTEHYADRYSSEQKLAARRALGLSADDYVIGLCGGLRPEKAHCDLLRAIAELRAQGTPAHALLIGDGPERPAIERTAARLSIEPYTHITGVQSDVRPFISLCDVMALVSHSETFSLAALEAMSMGKPMVMSAIGGAREQVLHGSNGLLFEAGDIGALTAHLASLTSEPLRARMGALAAQRVREHFQVDRMVAGFGDRLLEVMCEPPHDSRARRDSNPRPSGSKA